MPRGVCQGSALGPLLFSLYINSVSSCFTSPLLLYADDLVLFDCGTNEIDIITNLSLQLEKLVEWCTLNGVKINFQKTNFMIFHKERDIHLSSVPCEKIYIRNESIDRVYIFKYLGLWFDPHLNFNVYFKSVTTKVVSRIKYLRGVKRYLTPQVMKIMVNSYIHSVIDYGLEIWAVQVDSDLQQLQNRVDRFLVEFFCPSYYKKRKKLILDRRQVNMHSILNQCNFLTVIERRNFISLKLAYKDFLQDKLELSDRQCRSFPLMKVVAHNTETYKKCLSFRTCKLWN
jgi:hypothetical protein